MKILKNEPDKVQVLKVSIKNLRTAQEELRLRRAEYNKAISDLVDSEE